MNKKFKIGDLFCGYNGNTDIKKTHINGRGYPVVSSGLENTGIIGFSDIEARIFPSNTITIDMFGNVFFRDFEYKVVTHARVFSLVLKNHQLTLKSGLYIVSILSWLPKVFSYNNMCSYNKIAHMNISLPVIEHPDPNHKYTVDDIDWQYMEDRIKELEEDRIKELDAYLKATKLDDYELTDEDKKILSLSRKSALNEDDSLETDCENGTVRFKKFNLGASYNVRGKTIYIDEDGLFNIIPTKKKINAIDIEFNGKHPYVARGEGKNGIRGYIDYDEKYLNEANTISFGQDTATVNYQSNRYFTGDKIQVFKLSEKYGSLTEDIAIYLINSIKKVFERFLWGQQSYALDIISKIKITLPVTPDGKPDFDYMERYIRAIEKLTIANVVKYKDEVIDTTKKLVNSQS